ncbi:MAG: hypothetical protein Q8P07_01455 [bacterium]|nr:hypothetical protein [bacterium]
MAEVFTVDQIKEFNIKGLALNKEKLGSLIFEKSYQRLEELRTLFLELIDLNHQKHLSKDEIETINSSSQRFWEYLRRLEQFNIELPNAKQVHDSFENEVENFYHTTTKSLRISLVYLRQEAARKSQDQKALAEEQKTATKARKQYEELYQQLKNELETLQKQKGEVEIAHGEVATKYLAVQFSKQSKEYEENADTWLSLRNKLYWILIGIIGANFFAYLLLFVLDKYWNLGLPPREIFTIEYGLVKLALLAVLSYGVGFASKNYNVNSHLAAINKHRRNVAQTLEDFLSTNPDRKSEMLRQGTEAMFKHVSIGYIRREEQKDNGPIYEIVNKFLPSKE